MMPQLDFTNDPARRCWVPTADGHPDFPIQNLPLGIFSSPEAEPRGGVAIGDMILDLRAALEAGLFTGDAAQAAEAASGPTLIPLLALGAARDWRSGLGCRNCWLSGVPSAVRSKGVCTKRQPAACICQHASGTTLISTSEFITPPMWAGYFDRTIRAPKLQVRADRVSWPRLERVPFRHFDPPP